jgi:hypothetical protein
LDRSSSKINLPPSPTRLEVFRLLLLKIEGTAYPFQDPASIEDLKAHLRSRIDELEAAAEIKPLPPACMTASTNV